MNNFDRPTGITIDEPGTGGKGESASSTQATSESTWYTVMNDLARGQLYIRTIRMINYVRIDIGRLSGLKSVKVVSFDTLNRHQGLDGTGLFLQ